MFTIGAFARMVGISAKTLRHYHDQGLLVPAWIDPNTGYRSYTLRQMDDAARISVLRRGGMPLALIRVVLEHPERAESVIREFQEELRRRRLEEDEALEQVATAATREDIAARTRRVPARSYAAVDVRVEGATDDDSDRLVEEVNARVDARATWLRGLLTSAGVAPVGEFWTVLGTADEALAVTVHWPLPDSATSSYVESLAEGVHYGRLPARVESFVEVPRPDRDGDASIQLAMSAVLSTAPDGAEDMRGIRQTLHGDRATVEYALTLEEDE
ncbi:MerR family transcriptional regulator [Spiractinospora alimapuensis]|uniref:MerR family transcriptional regulator n=1 Tax=Spiractinospora alimapuensis TaxID=2820884 RepID=UPI001F462F3B|nr:MerR family transcriptional regulator [Spiractinospora alimapuensis]QVQ50774.1 MerR family transcriptional regulator [Spiractinospora alimapuensis]